MIATYTPCIDMYITIFVYVPTCPSYTSSGLTTESAGFHDSLLVSPCKQLGLPDEPGSIDGYRSNMLRHIAHPFYKASGMLRTSAKIHLTLKKILLALEIVHLTIKKILLTPWRMQFAIKKILLTIKKILLTIKKVLIALKKILLALEKVQFYENGVGIVVIRSLLYRRPQVDTPIFRWQDLSIFTI